MSAVGAEDVWRREAQLIRRFVSRPPDSPKGREGGLEEGGGRTDWCFFAVECLLVMWAKVAGDPTQPAGRQRGCVAHAQTAQEQEEPVQNPKWTEVQGWADGVAAVPDKQTEPQRNRERRRKRPRDGMVDCGAEEPTPDQNQGGWIWN